jgi:hypothetical protein
MRGILPPPPLHLGGARNVHLGEEVLFCFYSHEFEFWYAPARVIEITADGLTLEVLVSIDSPVPEWLTIECVAYSVLPVTSTWRFFP